MDPHPLEKVLVAAQVTGNIVLKDNREWVQRCLTRPFTGVFSFKIDNFSIQLNDGVTKLLSFLNVHTATEKSLGGVNCVGDE